MSRRKYDTIYKHAFVIGFIICAVMAVVLVREKVNIPLPVLLSLLLYGMLGGWLIGGIVSGILMFIIFIKKRSTVFKILCIVLFPITYVGIMMSGILGGIPYYLYNRNILKKQLSAFEV